MSRKSLVVFVALLGCITSISAQVLGPADLEAAAAGSLPIVTNPPFVGDFWTWKEGLLLPFDLWPDLTVYDLGSDRGYLIDNRSVPDFAPEWMSPLEPAPQIASGSGPGPYDLSGPNYGCQLWLSIKDTTNAPAAVLLTLHGTRAGQTYPIWSSTDVSIPLTNWPVETNVVAAGDPTEMLILMAGRSNLFLRTMDSRDYTNTIAFPGIDFSDDNYEITADVMGAVGPNHFVELLNGEIAVYMKTGLLIAQTNMAGFFSTVDQTGTTYPTGVRMTDPRILFDHASQRWVASGLDYTGSGQVIMAVSNGDSPTNLDTGWTRYVVPVRQHGYDADFDTLGLDANGVYLTVLQLDPNTAAYGGHTIAAIKKPELYEGTNLTTMIQVSTSELTSWAIQPAVSFDNAPLGGYAWFAAKGPPNLGANYQGGSIFYRRLQWIGNNAAWADTNWMVAVGTNYQDYYDLEGTNTTIFPGPTLGAPQEGTPTLIDISSIGSRLGNLVSRNGALWTSQMVGLSGTNGLFSGDSSGTNVDRSAIQWLKLEIGSNVASLAVVDHGRIFDASRTNAWWYYFPSLAADCAGDIVTGFSGSSPSNYISAFYMYRTSSGWNPPVPTTVQAGVVTNVGNRWGDYCATTVDPADGWSFWPVLEYALPGTNSIGQVRGRWGTVVTKVRPVP